MARIQEKYDQVYGAGRVEVSGVDDIIDGDFTAALKGVDAIIHVASPMTGRTDPETNIQVSASVSNCRPSQADCPTVCGYGNYEYSSTRLQSGDQAVLRGEQHNGVHQLG